MQTSTNQTAPQPTVTQKKDAHYSELMELYTFFKFTKPRADKNRAQIVLLVDYQYHNNPDTDFFTIVDYPVNNPTGSRLYTHVNAVEFYKSYLAGHLKKVKPVSYE